MKYTRDGTPRVAGKLKISVAMATYNGETFLNEQLESIASQTFLPKELVIRDDGSTDSTPRILEQFARVAPFPVRILGNGENLGFADNFLTVASHCQGDWIAFCDQDDVWLPEKIETCARELAEAPDGLVMLLHQARVVDRNLNPAGRLLANIPGRRLFGPGEFPGFWMLGGLAQIVRADLIRSFDWTRRPPDPGGRSVIAHDYWACILAHAIGRILMIPDVLTLYRRHDSGLTGLYGRTRLSESLASAAKTGAAYYNYVAQVASETAPIFRDLASSADNPLWSRRLNERAACFEQIERIHRGRARIYSAAGPAERLAAFFALCATPQAYFGNPVWSLGRRALAKDFATLLMPRLFQAREPAVGP